MRKDEKSSMKAQNINVVELLNLESLATERREAKKTKGKCMCACGAGYWAQQ